MNITPPLGMQSRLFDSEASKIMRPSDSRGARAQDLGRDSISATSKTGAIRKTKGVGLLVSQTPVTGAKETQTETKTRSAIADERSGPDRVSISEKARALAGREVDKNAEASPSEKAEAFVESVQGEVEDAQTLEDDLDREENDSRNENSDEFTEQTRENNREAGETVNGLSEEEQEVVQELQNRDREVRTHEQAHAAVGGIFAGAPSYTFQRGPDGQNYAVGGEVPIDVSAESTPEATIRKMQIVRRAALAPAQPSNQDRQVAAEAAATEREARAALAEADGNGTAAKVASETEPDDTGSELQPEDNRESQSSNMLMNAFQSVQNNNRSALNLVDIVV